MHFATAVIVPAELEGRELEDHLFRELAVFDEGEWGNDETLVAPLFDYMNPRSMGWEFPCGGASIAVGEALDLLDRGDLGAYYLIDAETKEFACEEGYLFPDEYPDFDGEGDWFGRVKALLAPKAAEFPVKARAMLAAREGDKVVMVDFHS